MEKRISMNAHKTPKGIVLALCDIELLGKLYKGIKAGEIITLNLDQYRSFYESKGLWYVNAEEVSHFIKTNKIHVINAVGKASISVILSLDLASKEEVIYFSGVPHIQVYYVRLKE